MITALRASAGVLAVTASALVFAQAPPAPSPSPVLAIENVTVIPMDSERVLKDHTVIVEGRRITAVGPERDRSRRKGRCASKGAAVS